MTNSPVSSNGKDRADGHILKNLMMFAEVLRRLGLDVGSGNVLDLVRATEHAPLGRKQDFRQAARCILVHRQQDLSLFDEAFQIFWRIPATGQIARDLRSMGEQRMYRNPQVGPPPDSESDEDSDLGRQQDDESIDRIDLTRTYSNREVLREKDFADFTSAEIADAHRLMTELSWDLGLRRTRRLVPGRGSGFDLRRTLRRNLKYGGEPLELAQRQRKNKRRPLVLICDVSGSMERYTRMLLHFIHSIAGGLDQVEAFLFATRLTRITRYLSHRGVDRTVTEVTRAVPDWAGGTRIGLAIKTFNYQWLRRVLGGGAVVLIISDGWDRGEPELLAKEASRLQRSCQRLIWLNPLLGAPEYQPLTQGMQAALPYIDDFLPVHNLHNLESLARHLNDLGPRRAIGRAYRPTPAGSPEVSVSPQGTQEIDPNLAPTFRHPLWGRKR